MDDVQTSKKKMPSKKEWRGFYSLILIQAQNAFNEKAAQFLLIPLGVWLAANSAVYGPDSWVNSLQYILACIFVLPYILFSPFVGLLLQGPHHPVHVFPPDPGAGGHVPVLQV